MPDYSIFVLEETRITVSGGGQLDGVTQGDGSHLVGRTITLDAPDWIEVAVTDNDPRFSDNDGSQRLDGAQTLNGVTYPNGARLEAEYSITLSDGTDSWTAIGFNVNDSSPAYATIEGLAFIGGPGGFPPTGVPLTVTAAQEGPNFVAATYATPICYDAGTEIETDRGPRPVETLTPGDRIATADTGLVPIHWVGGRHVIGAGRFAPVEIAAGAWGATRTLRVSQQHRILIRDPRAELLFGTPEVFVPAIALTAAPGTRLVSGAACHYHHLLLDRHEVIRANGAWSESLDNAAATGRGEEGELLRTFFPGLALPDAAPGPLSRPCLRRREGELLARAISAAAPGPGLPRCA